MHSYEACIADQRLKHAAQRMYDVVRDEPRQEAHRELENIGRKRERERERERDRERKRERERESAVQEAHRELGKDIFHVSEPYARAQTEFDTPLCK